MENTNKLGQQEAYNPISVLELDELETPTRAALRPILVSWLRNKLGDIGIPIPGGQAFQLNIVNPENGKPFAATITISILQNGYNLEALREKEKEKISKEPTERQRELQMEKELKAALAAENLNLLESWVAAGGLQQRRKTAEEIRDEIPEYATFNPQRVGALLNKLRVAGKLDYVLNERRKKVWYEVGGPLQPKDTIAAYSAATPTA